jgi:hypothetical protein
MTPKIEHRSENDWQNQFYFKNKKREKQVEQIGE